MSLLKVKRNNIKIEGIPFTDFKVYANSYIVAPTIEDFKGMLHTYGLFSIKYLADISETFTLNQEDKDKMVFMNSLIAEVANELQIKYFHREKGYSIVDKVLAYIIDNGVPKDFTYIDDIITDINTDDSTN